MKTKEDIKDFINDNEKFYTDSEIDTDVICPYCRKKLTDLNDNGQLYEDGVEIEQTCWYCNKKFFIRPCCTWDFYIVPKEEDVEQYLKEEEE